MFPKEKINFLDFDIYSRRISFYYRNKEKFGSVFGFILTILYIVLSLIIFLFYLLKTLKREDVTSFDIPIYTNEIPSFNINNELFYFAFGLEDPIKSTRFIDERIYYPKVFYIEKMKENGQFIDKSETILNIERCNNTKFGEHYQKLLEKEELNNSYCLKNINLTLKGGLNYNLMSYIKINIYSCINTTENNNHCMPKNIIDKYLTSTYFSLLSKDIGFNPFNYSFPVIPLLQYLYTGIDKSILKEYLIYFGVTEINTDIGLFSNKIKKETYLKYRRDFHSFFFIDDEKYYSGNEILTTKIMLEEYINFQKRTFTKMTQVLSATGGYMQVISTIFALVALLTKKFSLEQKLLNNLFNFNIKQRKIILCIEYKKKLDYNSMSKNKIHNFIPYEAKKSIVSKKSRRDSVIILHNNKHLDNINNISNTNINTISLLKKSATMKNPNISIKDIKSQKSFKSKRESNDIFQNLDKEKENEQNNNNIIDQNINRSKVNMIMKEDDFNLNEIIASQKRKKSRFNFIDDLKIFDTGRRSTVNFTIFDYYCLKKIRNKKTEIDLFNFGINFFKSQMDIINFFNIIILTQILLAKSTDKKENYLSKTIELFMK